MSSKDYKEPEDGGKYGARPVKADQKDDIDDDDDGLRTESTRSVDNEGDDDDEDEDDDGLRVESNVSDDNA